jgi:hypothetical protein
MTIPPALLHPEPTADAAVRRHNEALRRHGPPPRDRGLDVAALSRRYGGDPASTVQTRVGVFRVPLGSTWEAYARLRDAALRRFSAELERRGYRLVPRKGAVRVAPGIYPARHPETGVALLDQREFRVSVDCSFPGAEPVVIALDPEDVAPTPREER